MKKYIVTFTEKDGSSFVSGDFDSWLKAKKHANYCQIKSRNRYSKIEIKRYNILEKEK